jgi:hypothetical protein
MAKDKTKRFFELILLTFIFTWETRRRTRRQTLPRICRSHDSCL